MPQSRLTLVVATALIIAASPFAAIASYNSEEHKLIVDRGAALVNIRSAVLPFPTRMLNYTSTEMIAGYKAAKHLAVGIESNDASQYSDQTHKVQDNSYWSDPSTQGGFAQLAGNLNIHVPLASEVAPRTIVVPIWDGTADAAMTMGELAALYGDYRRTVNCSTTGTTTGRCYLTNRNSPQYVFGATRPAGIIDFAYGDDCFGVLNLDCGWRPDPVATRTYLRAIGSGLWPPYGGLGNQFQNTAYASEELDAGWWGDEMLRIANVNDWHFSQAAVAWYVGMHRLALKYVALARSDNRYWNVALNYEASALHSLTDLFAFGHVVTSRDRTSFAIMGINKLTGDPAYAWMENVSAMGGGYRDPGTGKVELTSILPNIADMTNNRNDFMETDRGSWAFVAKTEHDYHDQFNNGGATVMNLKRQEFSIFGDAKLRFTPEATQRVIVEAVRASIQSLFDAYESPKSIDVIGAVGSSYFDALLNIPVYVKSNTGNQFNGMWARYAIKMDAITGAGIVPDTTHCVIPFLDGQETVPAARATPCATPASPSQTAIVSQLLQANGDLGKGDQQGLDASGNANGGYDVGDFLAWVRRTNATPSARGGRP